MGDRRKLEAEQRAVGCVLEVEAGAGQWKPRVVDGVRGDCEEEGDVDLPEGRSTEEEAAGPLAYCDGVADGGGVAGGSGRAIRAGGLIVAGLEGGW